MRLAQSSITHACDRCGIKGHSEYTSKESTAFSPVIFHRILAYSTAMSGPHGDWFDVCSVCLKDIEKYIYKTHVQTTLR